MVYRNTSFFDLSKIMLIFDLNVDLGGDRFEADGRNGMIGLTAPGDSMMTQICIVAKDVETAKRVKRLEQDYGRVSRIIILRECDWDSEGFDDASIVQLGLSKDVLEKYPNRVRAELLAADIQADLVIAAVDLINEAPVIQEVAKVCPSIVSIRATNG
jgi:hypothetical protein